MTPDGRAHIVVVCTANRCRSPVAAALLARGIASRRLDAEVSSAGFLRSGEPVPDQGLAVAATLGLDLSAHRSTVISGSLVESADLVLTMSRSHARDIVARWPEAWPRTFTYKQFARWIIEVKPPRHAAVGAWLDAAASERPRTALIGRSPDDDVADPIGRSDAIWRGVVEEIDAATTPILDRLAPLLLRG